MHIKEIYLNGQSYSQENPTWKIPGLKKGEKNSKIRNNLGKI